MRRNMRRRHASKFILHLPEQTCLKCQGQFLTSMCIELEKIDASYTKWGFVFGTNPTLMGKGKANEMFLTWRKSTESLIWWICSLFSLSSRSSFALSSSSSTISFTFSDAIFSLWSRAAFTSSLCLSRSRISSLKCWSTVAFSLVV